ncbi:MAG TPA: DUF416 family protein [Chitinophaga sp.]|uniref:DUF416 family protein n=1 Tax=Chitinophaga sp. TaxID=1869181 RepID=UPI002DB56463|nr:DUF416 family protein [Chitinophaga sp.]HEU4551293.1 DUF416 family protein [Chitinophaga sp.]
MVYNELKSSLINATSGLTAQQQTLFCIYCTEKIIDLYRPVVDKFGFGDYQQVRKMADFVWSSLLSYTPENVQRARLLREQVEQLVPDGDEYPGLESALAMNVCICLDVSLDTFSGAQNKAHIAGLYVYDTITQVLFSKLKDEKLLTEEVLTRVDNMVAVKNEIADQQSTLQLITSSGLDQQLVNVLRNQAVVRKGTIENMEVN